MTRPLLLDLFCGAGGAAMGYHRAGFDVVGVDMLSQPHYPFPFVQGDALRPPVRLAAFDVIHASPPCQGYSQMSARWGSSVERLLGETFTLLAAHPLWVVENVTGAKAFMPSPIRLTGGMFGLGTHRPRLFASNVLLMAPAPARPPANGIGVYGARPDGRWLYSENKSYRAASSLEEAQEAMGMDWADWHGTKEAIPPAYTEHIGHQLLAHIGRAAA